MVHVNARDPQHISVDAMLVCLFVYFFLYSSIRKILHPVIPDLMSVFLNKRRRKTGHNPHEHIFNIFESLSYWSTQLFFVCFSFVSYELQKSQHNLYSICNLGFKHVLFQCRKTGSPLYKHYKVYRRQTCSQCNEKITVCRLGENNRMTYFCSRCQKADPQLVNVRYDDDFITLKYWCPESAVMVTIDNKQNGCMQTSMCFLSKLICIYGKKNVLDIV